MSFPRRHLILLLCLINLSLVFCSASYSRSLETMEEESLGLLKYEIDDVYVGNLTHTIQIINRSPFPVRGELFVPLIKNETRRCVVILHDVSSSKAIHQSILNDASGNVYFYLDELRIDGEQNVRVELNYYVFSFSIHYLVNSSIVENYDTGSEIYRVHTKPEELIECDDSRIVSLARNLTVDVDDWHEKALRINDFVRHHMHYEVQEEEMGALWALEKRLGDCSEYSYLFVALCRAAGIPARIQAGFAFHSENEVLEDGHMWAEYYLENYGWVPVDVTWRLFDVIDDRHFGSIQSVPETMSYANYFFDCEVERNVEDEQTVSLVPCSLDVFNSSFIENVMNTVQKTKQARFAIYFGKIFGTHLIFSSEVEDVEKTLIEGKVQLQSAIDFWDENPQIAESRVTNALEKIEKTLQNTWMLIVKVFIIFVSISVSIMLTAFFFLKQRQSGRKNLAHADLNTEQVKASSAFANHEKHK